MRQAIISVRIPIDSELCTAVYEFPVDFVGSLCLFEQGNGEGKERGSVEEEGKANMRRR